MKVDAPVTTVMWSVASWWKTGVLITVTERHVDGEWRKEDTWVEIGAVNHVQRWPYGVVWKGKEEGTSNRRCRTCSCKRQTLSTLGFCSYLCGETHVSIRKPTIVVLCKNPTSHICGFWISALIFKKVTITFSFLSGQGDQNSLFLNNNTMMLSY